MALHVTLVTLHVCCYFTLVLAKMASLYNFSVLGAVIVYHLLVVVQVVYLLTFTHV